MERLKISKTKLMWVNQQKRTLENIMSSLPVQKCPDVAKVNTVVKHNPIFPQRDASFLLTLEPQPVCRCIRKDLSKVSKIVFCSFGKTSISDIVLILNLMKY